MKSLKVQKATELALCPSPEQEQPVGALAEPEVKYDCLYEEDGQPGCLAPSLPLAHASLPCPESRLNSFM